MKNLKFIGAWSPWVVITLLLMISSQVNGQNKNDLKLFETCKEGDIKKAEKLISKGANVNYYSAFHETPLLIAVDRNNNELAKLLITKGANSTLKADCFFVEFQHKRKNGTFEVRVGKKQEGENALILAIENGNEEIFNLLMEQGIDINFEYQPSIQVGNYSNGLLYSLRNPLSGPPKMGNVNININGVQVTRSETTYEEFVCIVNSKPIEPMKYTPLKVAVLAKNKNYSIIEKLAETSSIEMNNDLYKMAEFINDSKTIEILKEYKYIN